MILLLAFWIILIVVGINKKSAKQLSFVAGGVYILRFAVIVIGNIVRYGNLGLDFTGFLGLILTTVGVFMIGMAFDCITTNVTTNAHSSSNAAVSTISAESQIDRLIRLKGLLDGGIISQDEFEAKKKQILGQ